MKAPEIKEFKNERYPYFVVWSEIVNGKSKRKKKACKNITSAKNLLAEKKKHQSMYGVPKESVLSNDEKNALEIWREYAENKDITLTDAINGIISHHTELSKSVQITIACDEFIKFKKAEGVKSRQVKDLESYTNKIKSHFGAENCLTSLTSDSINEWLMNLQTTKEEDATARTKINHRRAINNLLNYCCNVRKWISENPGLLAIKPKVEQKEITFYSIENIQKLLSNAEDQDVKLFIILQAFCGLRTSEVYNLEWENIDLEDGYIRPDGKTGKRLVEIPTNALAALKGMKGEGLVIQGKKEGSVRTLTTQMFKAAKVQKLANGYRHSFGTYHLSKGKNWMETTAQMGNSKEVLEKHYAGLVTNKLGVAWFDLKLT